MSARLSNLRTPVPLLSLTMAPPRSVLQRKCACGESPGVTGDCQECSGKRLKLQRNAASQAEESTAPPIVHEVLRSSGQPLDAETRAFMEPRFGHDFKGVRVHADMRAAESASAINALAYTVGRDMVFGGGKYAPATTSGQRLLAHELTHVVQQHNASPAAILGIDPEPELESEAAQAESNFRPGSLSGSVTALQRKVNRDGEEELCGGTWTCAASPCEQPDPGRKGAGKGSAQSLKVMIDTEEKKARQVIFNVGHTYVEFTDLTGSVYTYGFYPYEHGAANPFHQKANGCVVHPDTNHKNCVDYIEEFDSLGETEFNAALQFAQTACLAPPTYDLQAYNCTTFAQSVVEKAGKTLPALCGKVSPLGLHFDNPNTLKEGLEKLHAGPTYGLSSNAKIRDAISKASSSDLAASVVVEKVRIINELLEGRVSDDDIAAIERVCASVSSKEEMQAIATAVKNRKNKLHDVAQKLRFEAAISRTVIPKGD